MTSKPDDDYLALLPFKPESIPSWTYATDLMLFLKSYLGGSTSIDSRGKKIKEPINYSYAEGIFNDGKKKFRVLATQFIADANRAIPAPGAKDQVEPIPNFLKDGNFGLVAKYSIAWEAAIRGVLEESEFYSVAHILESYDDLECSIELASKLYYKHALQVLRNFVEINILHLYFIIEERAFDIWKDGDFRIPPIRGQKGLLKELVSKRVFSGSLAKTTSHLYDKLNGSIHGSEDKLINRGCFTGEWHGRIFKYVRYLEWCDYFSRCVTFGLHTLNISVNLLKDVRSKGPFRCHKCWNKADFCIEKRQVLGYEYVHVRCKRCGEQMVFTHDGAVKRGLLGESEKKIEGMEQ